MLSESIYESETANNCESPSPKNTQRTSDSNCPSTVLPKTKTHSTPTHNLKLTHKFRPQNSESLEATVVSSPPEF